MSLANAQTHPAPRDPPVIVPGHQGPFREVDLLAIGTVLAVVLAILGWRRFARKRD